MPRLPAGLPTLPLPFQALVGSVCRFLWPPVSLQLSPVAMWLSPWPFGPGALLPVPELVVILGESILPFIYGKCSPEQNLSTYLIMRLMSLLPAS